MEFMLELKLIHVLTVIISGVLFLLRGLWQWRDSPRRTLRWVRVAPHINDSILLFSAFILAWRIEQFPFTQDWLTAKVIALIGYIGLGMIAMRWGRTRQQRFAAWIAALLVYVYIVGVAISKSPTW